MSLPSLHTLYLRPDRPPRVHPPLPRSFDTLRLRTATLFTNPAAALPADIPAAVWAPPTALVTEDLHPTTLVAYVFETEAAAATSDLPAAALSQHIVLSPPSPSDAASPPQLAETINRAMPPGLPKLSWSHNGGAFTWTMPNDAPGNLRFTLRLKPASPDTVPWLQHLLGCPPIISLTPTSPTHTWSLPHWETFTIKRMAPSDAATTRAFWFYAHLALLYSNSLQLLATDLLNTYIDASVAAVTTRHLSSPPPDGNAESGPRLAQFLVLHPDKASDQVPMHVLDVLDGQQHCCPQADLPRLLTSGFLTPTRRVVLAMNNYTSNGWGKRVEVVEGGKDRLAPVLECSKPHYHTYTLLADVATPDAPSPSAEVSPAVADLQPRGICIRSLPGLSGGSGGGSGGSGGSTPDALRLPAMRLLHAITHDDVTDNVACNLEFSVL